MSSYIVVFEYTKEAGGYAGIRTWTDFNNKREFKRLWKPTGREAVLEEDVPQERALELTCRTPEASRVKSAIEDSFRGTCFDFNLFTQLHLFKAVMAIEFDRVQVNRYPYTLRYPHDRQDQTDAKATLFAVVDSCADPETGQLDLDLLSRELSFAVMHIMLGQLNKFGPDDGDMLG